MILSSTARRALRLKPQATYALPRHPDAPVNQAVDKFAGTYDGAELRRVADRPGAMDAYYLPSRGLST